MHSRRDHSCPVARSSLWQKLARVLLTHGQERGWLDAALLRALGCACVVQVRVAQPRIEFAFVGVVAI